MKYVLAKRDQTLWDIAVQEIGDVSVAFQLADLNPLLQLDMAIPTGYKVHLPETIVKPHIVDYFKVNKIYPVSGLGEEVEINNDDMAIVRQLVNYDLSGGDHEFPKVRLLRDRFTVQANYSGISSRSVKIYIDQSNDGEAWSQAPLAQYTLNPDCPNHMYNYIGLNATFARIRIHLSEVSSGKIDEIIWKL